MSLITQCPACGTMFRVVPDQLRISEGWARCGQCNVAFDANAHLQPPHELAPDAVEAAAPPLNRVAAEPASDGYDWGDVLKPQASSPMKAESGPGAPVAGHALPPIPASALPPAEPLPVSPPEPLQTRPGLTEHAPLSFMAKAPPAARWGRRPLVAMCLILGAMLVLQVLLMERNRLAAVWPGLRPALDQTCAALGCQMSAVRQIESISIDSSAFNNVKPGLYQLTATLKNGAAMALAMPTLELTLNDLQEQILVRRVIVPADFSASDTLVAGAELSLNVSVQVDLGAATDRISGYKLLAFYP